MAQYYRHCAALGSPVTCRYGCLEGLRGLGGAAEGNGLAGLEAYSVITIGTMCLFIIVAETHGSANFCC